MRAENAQGTPTRSHISPTILVYEDKSVCAAGRDLKNTKTRLCVCVAGRT